MSTFLAAVTLVGAFISSIIYGTSWAIELQGRVNGHDSLFEEREKLATERHAELKNDLTRIERKLDKYNAPGYTPRP